LIGNFYFNLKEKLHKYLGIPKYIKFSDLEIKITPDHLLKYFKKKYPTYNEFLPIISKHLDKNTIFIDVGANCGDTLFSIFEKNKYLYFYCFEADKEFFKYLKFNKKKISKNYRVNKIKLFNELIGSEIKEANLSGGHGTKKIDRNFNKNLPFMKSKKLDSFFRKEKKKISFLKSDVDGFDYDILNSSLIVIKKHRPIIFFECECSDNDNLMKYFKIIMKLKKFKYHNFVLFNNYGKFTISTSNIGVVKKRIKDQLLNKKRKLFFDILMYTQKDKQTIINAIKEFKKID
jgi:FkbM family methyltransferase|tara:strand:+ start:1116 stop:1982 length:867 start_codon:yes stop_codon:yes gene_type:complete